MCFAAAPFILMGLSAAAGAANAAAGAAARNRQAEYNARVAQNNALMARQEGGYAKAQALRNATEKRKATARLVGTQRARQGASGVVVDSGSAADLVLETAGLGEREAMALLQEGDVVAWRVENQARGYEAQARLARNSRVSAGTAVAGPLLSSATSATSHFLSLGG